MQKTILLFVYTLLLASCVTKKQFTELSKKHDKLSEINSGLIAKNDALLSDKNTLDQQLKSAFSEKKQLSNQIDKLKQELQSSQNKYRKLNDAYELLASQSSSEASAKAKENQNLLLKLGEKERKLFEEQAALQKLTSALAARSKRIEDLENLIAQKEQAMQTLKNAISNALKGFEGKGLSVKQRDGKVYVSMENKLLFQSGQWKVGTSGTTAVAELAKVLVQNPTIHVLIEGHTDDDPYTAKSVIEDNWDLSVKRATAIVKILQKNNVAPEQLTAAGRSKYSPVAENTTALGKAKNRRIEIVLSPNLDEVTKLLTE